MANNGNNINFKLNFQMGDTKAFNELKAKFNEVRELASDMGNIGLDTKQMQSTLNAVNVLEQALNRAYDPTLNTINIQKFNQLLLQSGMDANKLQTELSAVGFTGQQAFLKATSQLMQFNTATKQTNKFLDNIATTLFNTIKWTATSSIINNISGSIQKSYYYVKDLDSSLNDIRIVTNKSAEDMAEFAVQANNAAKALAVTTEDYTQGALIYYQQGLDDETVKALTDVTAMTSNVTGQSMSTVSEQLTAVQNGYQVANEAAKEGMQVYQEYVDKMAAVGATTASDLEELSTAMSKVASAASSMGVDFDDLNAQIATIVSVTRQAPESVGTALKTIYARLGDLKVDGVDEFGTKLGEVSNQLKTMGIDIIDQTGNMRNMSDVIAEVAEKQNLQTDAQRQAAAIAMAGKRQYNNLIALFDNQDMYGEALETSMNAAGTLEEQQEIAMESLKNKMDVLKATAEDLYDSLFDTDTIGGFIDAGTGILKFFTEFTDSVGGLNNILPTLAFNLTQLFSGQIANGIGTLVNNMRIASDQEKIMAQNAEQLKILFSDSALIQNLNGSGSTGVAAVQGFEELKQYYNEMQQYQQLMTKEEKEQYNEILKNIAALGEKKILLADEVSAQERKNEKSKLINKELIKESSSLIEINKQADNLINLSNILEENLEGVDLVLKDTKTKRFDSVEKTFKEAGTNLDPTTLNNIIDEYDRLFKKEQDAQKALDKLIENMREAGKGANEIAKIRNEIANLQGPVDNVGNALKKNLDTKAIVQNITSAVSAVGQLAMAMRTLSNTGEILNNDDLTSIEKFSQIMFNLSIVVPSIVGAYKPLVEMLERVRNGYSLISTSINTYNQAKQLSKKADEAEIALAKAKEALEIKKKARDEAEIALQNVKNNFKAKEYALKQDYLKKLAEEYVIKTKGMTIEEKEIALKEIESKVLPKNNKQRQAHITALHELIIQEEKETALKTANAAVTEAEADVEAKDTAAITAHTAAQEQDNKVTLTRKALALGIIGVVGAVAVATVTAAIAIRNAEMKRAEEARERREEEQKAYLEQRENTLKEVKEQQKLYDTYAELYNQYQKGIVTKEDFISKSNDLISTLSEEDQAVLALTDNYNGLLEKVKEYNKEALQKEYEQNKNDISSQRNNIKNIFGNNLDSLLFQKEDYDGSFQNQMVETGKGTAIESQNGVVDVRLDYEKLSLHELIQIGNYLHETKNITQDQYNDLAQYFSNLSQLEKNNNTLDIEKQLSKEQLDNIEKFETYNDKLLDVIKQLSAEGSEYQNSSYTEKIKKAIELIGKYSSGNTEHEQRALASATLIDKYGEENANDIMNQLSNKTITEIKGILNIDSATNQTDLKNNYERYIGEAYKNLSDKYSKESYQQSSTLLSKIQNGDITSENALKDQDYKDLINNLEIIKEAYPEINSEIEIVNKTQLIGTQQYAEALEKVQDKMYELSMAQAVTELNKKITDAIDQLNKIDIKTPESIEAFKDSLDQILNAQYEIDVQIHTEADQEFTNLSKAFDNLDKSAAKIGENFIVAADDIRELNNAFPGIVEGLAYLKDGTVKLNKDMVESAMAAAEAEAKADAEATVIKLKNQADLLRAKQKTYEKLANAALILAKGETATEEEAANARAEMSAELEHLKELNSQESANSQMNNAKEVADNSHINARITGDNQRSAFQEMAQASYKAASAAIQNMQAVVSKRASDLVNTNLDKVQYAGTSGLAEDASIINATQGLLEGSGDQKQAEIAEKYAQMADAAGAAANDIDGMIMQIGAKSIALDKDLGSIARGKGKVKDSKSGSSKNKDKDKKEQEDEFDRYWEIKKAIEAVDNALKKLDKDKQNLYGYELIDALKKENDLLEQQAANYNRLYEMQQQEAAELREQLGTMGLMFDASGAITNYAAATSAALAQYSAAIEQYNAGLIDETTLGVYEKAYNNFKKLLERYDKLYYTEMQNTQDKLDELRRKELANNLKSQEVEIQIHLDKEKMKRDQNDFLKDVEQDFKKVFPDLTIDVKFDKKNFDSLVNDVNTTIKAIKEVEAEIDKMMNGGTSDMFESISQAQEKLKELQEKLLEQGKSLREIYKQVQDTYLKGLDQVKEKFEELMKRYERFNNELEYHRQLIELLYGDKAYDLMDKYYEAQTENIDAQISSLRQQADFWQNEFNKSFESAIAQGSDVDINDYTTWTEDMKKAYENMVDSQEKLNDLVLEGVKVLQDQYLNTINKIMDAMDKGIWGSGGFQGMKDNQEFMQKMAEEYLDDVEGASAIQLFANRMDMDKANATTLKAQQKIQDFREKEIKALREKENLTQADIDLAEARYQLMLKEIALEDAQNNKTSMKLTRNEQGNQTYQYVADEDDVAQKEQDLLQSYADLYKLADNSYQHSMELAMDLYEEMYNKIQQIASDVTLTEEEKQQKIQEIQDMYLPQIEAAAANSELYKQEAMIASAGVFATVCEQDATAYETLTDYQKELVDSLRDKNFEDYDAMREAIINGYYPDLRDIATEVFNETNINSQTIAAQAIGTWAKNPDSVKNIVIKAISDIKQATIDYEEELKKLQEIAGVNFNNIAGYIDNVVGKIHDMDGATGNLADNSSKYLDELRKWLETIADNQDSVIKKIQDAHNAMQDYLDLKRQADAGGGSNGGGSGGGNSGQPGGGDTPGDGGDPSNPGGPGGKTKANQVIGDRITGTKYSIGYGTIDDAKEALAKLLEDNNPKDGYPDNLPPTAQLYKKQGDNDNAFFTGGYTGVQNNGDSNGRLAMLHQKEIVLNKDDTENLLESVSLIRDMTAINGSISDAIASAVVNTILSLSKGLDNRFDPIGMANPEYSESGGNVFNITAEFPNANNADEIREAILSLPNYASQYSGKRRRYEERVF